MINPCPTSQCITAFDLDRTLVRVNSSFRFSLQLIFRKKLPFSTIVDSFLFYLRHTAGWLSLEDMHQMVFSSHLKGYSLDVLKDEVRRFVSKFKESDFYLPAFHHFKRAQELGHYTVLLSSSPNFLVDSLGEFFGFDETFASVYEVDKENNLCHISSILQGDGKAKILTDIAKKLGIAMENTFAYSDSHLDLPFLEESGVPVLVNPDKKLRHISKTTKWLTI